MALFRFVLHLFVSTACCAQLEHTYTGPLDSAQAHAMRACDPEGPLMVHVVKLFAAEQAPAFRALGRVLSGTLYRGQKVRVLGEQYRPPVDTEDWSGTRPVVA